MQQMDQLKCDSATLPGEKFSQVQSASFYFAFRKGELLGMLGRVEENLKRLLTEEAHRHIYIQLLQHDN